VFDSSLPNYCILADVGQSLHYAQFIKMLAEAAQQSGDFTLHSILLSLCHLGILAGSNDLQVVF
jgi:hypothetical protein